MDQDFNTTIFRFIDLLEKKKLNSSGPPDSDMVGNKEILHLGEVENLKVFQQDPSGRVVSAFYDVHGVLIGLSQENYSKFQDLVSDVHDTAPFKDKCSYSFLEKRAFEWMISVYRNSRAEQSLLHFLFDCLDQEFKEFTFYIPITPLAIKQPIHMGCVEITFLTSEFIEREESKFMLAGKTKEQFQDFMKSFIDLVLIKTNAKGDFEKAKQIAFRQAEMAVNILKCFFHEFGIHNQYKIPDLNYRLHHTQWSPVLHNHSEQSEEHSNLEVFAFNEYGTGVIEIEANLYERLIKQKLDLFIQFFNLSSKSEFYYAVSSAIISFSKMVSTVNLYEKTSKLISFFEAILINENLKQGKGEKIMKKQLMPKLLKPQSDVDLSIELTGYFYRIRDAYVHHGEERPIDFKKFFQFQTIAFRFLTHLIELNSKMSSMDEFYKYLLE